MSKSHEDRVHSAAAYLLFYRRRSDKPLGPEELQALVSEYRNPTASTEDGEDGESGEAKLGGRTLSGSGSSSGLAGVGAGAKSIQKAVQGGSGGTGAEAGRHLTTKTTQTKSDVMRDLHGNQTWGFTTPEDDAADALIKKVDAPDSDDGSTTAVHGNGHDSAMEACRDSPPELVGHTAGEDTDDMEYVNALTESNGLNGSAEDEEVYEVKLQ